MTSALTYIPDGIRIPSSSISKQRSGSRLPLYKEMGLDRGIVLSFTAIVRDLSEKYLDTSMTWKQQDEARRNRCVNEVCKCYPWVREYEDVWPVKTYIKSYLGVRRKEMRKLSASLRGHTEPSFHHETTAERITPVYTTRRRAILRDVKSQRSKIVTISDDDMGTESNDSGDKASSSAHNVHDTDGRPGHVHIQRTTSEHSESVVRQFLTSYCPSLKVAAPRLYEAGVCNETWLREMANMPEEDLCKFLEHKVGLNRLQTARLQVALKKYVAETAL